MTNAKASRKQTQEAKEISANASIEREKQQAIADGLIKEKNAVIKESKKKLQDQLKELERESGELEE